MRFDIRGPKDLMTPDLIQHTERRLDFALSRFRHMIHRVAVHLGDVNGPKGGIDQRCHVVARVRTGAPLVIIERDSDPLALIDRAADRLGHAVSRRVDRRRGARQSPCMATFATRPEVA